MESINIDRIMDEVREEIKDKGYTIQETTFSEIPIVDLNGLKVSDKFDLDEYEEELSFLKYRWNLPINMEFVSDNACKRIIKKIIQKLIRCVTAQMISRQNEVNENLVLTNVQIRNYIVKNEKQKKEMQKRIQDLEQEIERIRG
jgi:hypothetical protein